MNSAFTIFIGLLFIGFIWWLAFRRLASLKLALTAEATIIEMIPVQSTSRPERTLFIPRIRFQAQDGTEHLVTRVYSGPHEFQVGQKIRVAYDPTTYNADILKPRQTFYLIASATALTLAVAAILFVIIW